MEWIWNVCGYFPIAWKKRRFWFLKAKNLQSIFKFGSLEKWKCFYVCVWDDPKVHWIVTVEKAAALLYAMRVTWCASSTNNSWAKLIELNLIFLLFLSLSFMVYTRMIHTRRKWSKREEQRKKLMRIKKNEIIRMKT